MRLRGLRRPCGAAATYAACAATPPANSATSAAAAATAAGWSGASARLLREREKLRDHLRPRRVDLEHTRGEAEARSARERPLLLHAQAGADDVGVGP